MCSKSTEICFKNVPRWLWIIMIIAVIALIVVKAWKVNTSLKNTYEKKTVEKKKEKRKEKTISRILKSISIYVNMLPILSTRKR